jgi:hypothetical protein
MTEEDQYGYVMPDRYRCDACRAAVYHLDEALSQRQPKSRRLQEWEYQDIFDETCRHNFKGYGITLIDGENALSGPALKKDSKLAPGMGAIQMGGETWEKRLGEICRKLVYDRIGEEELYEHFRSNGGLTEDGICFKATRDCSVGPKAPAVEVEEPAGEKKAKKEKKEKKDKKKAEPTLEEKKVKKKAEPTLEEKKEKKKSEQTLDATAFLTKLAKEHGISKAEYTGKRGYAEWERVILAAAARISERSAASAEEVEVQTV